MADLHRIYPASDETQADLDQTQARLRALAHNLAQEALHQGAGGGNSGGMDSRVTKLETQMDFVRDDLREMKGDLKTIIGRLGELPTKRDLTTNTLTVVVIGLAVMAITIGGIVGGLAWIDRAGSVPPAPAVATAQR